MAKKKSKSMKGSSGGRKLATAHGRKKANSGGEPQKQGAKKSTARPKTGSSKQRKG